MSRKQKRLTRREPTDHTYAEHAGRRPYGHCLYCGASYEMHALVGTGSARNVRTDHQRCRWCEA